MSDQQLKLLERALAANDSEVIATWQVYKLRQADDYTGTNLLKALGAKSFLVGRSAPKPRVLCLSVRRSKSKGYKPLLSLFKPSSEAEAGFKASITCELHQVAELKLITPKASKQQQDQQQVVNGVTLKTLEVRILGDASSLTAPDDMVLRLGLVDEEQIMAVMAIAAQLLRLSNTKLPRLTGLLPEDLDVWWGSHQQQVLAALGKFAAEVLSTSVQADSGLGAATAVLMSAKEEKDLEELLDLHAMGLGDMAEFEARLQEEHDALEEANVQAVLAQVPLVDTVVLNMRKVQGMLEDLDANLVVLDAKLRHMRDDISAIESSNNSLELQARNNTKLLSSLEEVISDLKVSSDIQRTLEDLPIETETSAAMVDAAWTLHSQLRRLTPGNPSSLSSHLLHLRVMREARQQLTDVAARFVARASSHISNLLNQAVEEHATEVGKSTGSKANRILAPSHHRIQAVCSRYAAFVRVIKAMDADSVERLQDAYSQSVNMLLRKELKAACSDLRRASQLDAHQLDFSLVRDTGATRLPGQAGSMLSGSRDDDNTSVVSEVHGKGRGPASVGSAKPSRITSLPRTRGMPTWDGSSPSIPLNEAWGLLLDAYVPFLLQEAEAAANFLLLYEAEPTPLQEDLLLTKAKSKRRQEGDGQWQQEQQLNRKLTPEGHDCIAALMQGIDVEFQVLVELAAKGRQVLCIPMLADDTRWLGLIATRPIVFVVARTLALCHERMRGSLSGYITQQISDMDNYAAKTSSGVRDLHVLPFISKFAIISHHIEIMLADRHIGAGDSSLLDGGGGGESELGGAQQVPPPGPGALSGWTSGAPADLADLMLYGDEDDAEWMTVVAAARWSVRPQVDAMYSQLVVQMFSTLEQMADSDPKHGGRLRMENYSYFSESIRPLVGITAALEPFLVQAEARQQESMQAYIQQQLEWGGFWKLLEFAIKVEKLLYVDGLGASEVSFQPGCSTSDAKSLVNSTMKDADKKLRKMFDRVHKHLGATGLAFVVVQGIQDQLVARYKKLSKQLVQCYGTAVELPLSPEDLASIVKAAARRSDA